MNMTKFSITSMKKSIQRDGCISKTPLKLPDLHELVNAIKTRSRDFDGNARLAAAGIRATNDPEIARCDECKFEVKDWRKHVDLLALHANATPDCPLMNKARSSKFFTTSSLPPRNTVKCVTHSDSDDSPAKRLKIEPHNTSALCNTLLEANMVQQIRRRTFSHWPHRSNPSQAQMVEAGFFGCNVGDRVICIYCNLICQQWTPHTDDPSEVHRVLSPYCIYVKAKLAQRSTDSIVIVNENVTSGTSAAGSSADQFHCQAFVPTAACNPAYTELPKRTASFANWTAENSPSVDDLVRAGFFYAGMSTIVTCFYCNGSLQNWGPNDNPMIEHARWFPHCAYAKQLCGDELYRKIQESKRIQQERARLAEAKEKPSSTPSVPASSQSLRLQIPDETTLSRLVAARLDLPVSQNLLREFKLSIIKRCWEDQLRLKFDDFVSDADLRMACTILQKQITHIDGKKENIIVPSLKMKQLRVEAEKQRAEEKARELESIASTAQAPSDVANVEMDAAEETATSTTTTPAKPVDNPSVTVAPQPATIDDSKRKQADAKTVVNPCVVCMAEEKRLACMPCGHLAACVPCGHSLRCCPICRREIQAFVKIYT